MSITKWVLDPTHSEVQFKVKHLMITNVTGNFTKFNASMEMEEEEFSSAKLLFSADVDSVTTNNDQRDTHLRSMDFFDMENHPHVTFVSKKIEVKDGDTLNVVGDLSMRGVTKETTLVVEVGGIGTDPYGNRKAGFTVRGKINRTDYGINWNTALETGGVLVSNDVRLYADVQLVKQ